MAPAGGQSGPQIEVLTASGVVHEVLVSFQEVGQRVGCGRPTFDHAEPVALRRRVRRGLAPSHGDHVQTLGEGGRQPGSDVIR